MENTAEAVNQVPDHEEKTFAMLSHLSLLLGGIILPIIIWATQRDKSRFVRFHSLQAIFYHLMLAVIIFFFVLIALIFVLISGIGNLNNPGNSSMPPFLIFLLISFYAFIILLALAAVAYSIYIAVKAYRGERIKIFFIGNIIYRKVYGQS
ncbi:MAG: DUF4870 domain-containing protein [Bacteroidetes bacterium]|nr:DUF4870 domain-containing protein [Bacteroidota bacterium]